MNGLYLSVVLPILSLPVSENRLTWSIWWERNIRYLMILTSQDYIEILWIVFILLNFDEHLDLWSFNAQQTCIRPFLLEASVSMGVVLPLCLFQL